MLTNNSQNQLQLTGYYGEIWLEIAEKLGLEFDVIEGTAYGILSEDGHWNGLIGMVYKNEADIAIGDFYPTTSRKTVVDFALPTDID